MKSWAVYFRFSFRKALVLVLVAAVASPALALFGLTWETGQLAVAGLTLVVGTIFLGFAWAVASAIVARRFHFSLRTLLILTTLLAVLLATVVRWMLKARRDAAERAEAIATLQELGASFYFSNLVDVPNGTNLGWSRLANGLLIPQWVRSPFVDSYLSTVQDVNVMNRRLTQGDMIRLRAALECLPIGATQGVALRVRNCDLEDRELAVLVGMSGIRELDLVDNQLTDAACNLLAEMPELKVVYLDGNRMSVPARKELYRRLELRGASDAR